MQIDVNKLQQAQLNSELDPESDEKDWSVRVKLSDDTTKGPFHAGEANIPFENREDAVSLVSHLEARKNDQRNNELDGVMINFLPDGVITKDGTEQFEVDEDESGAATDEDSGAAMSATA